MLIRRLFRFRSTPLLALTAGLAGFLLLAGCRGPHCGWNASAEEKADKVAGRIAKELDLNADQKSRLDAIKKDLLARKADFSALHQGMRMEALGQLRSGTVDADRLNRSLEDHEAKAKELRAFLVAKFAEFHAMLEPAQREKLAAHIEKHGEKRGGKHRDAK